MAEFEWDPKKAAGNRRKHDMSFEEGESVIGTAAIFDDLDHSEDEDRFIAIGYSEKGRM